ATAVLRAHVAVVGARRPVRLLRIARAGGFAARAELRQVALTRRGPALGAGGREGIGRAVVTRPVAGLGHVAHTRRLPAHGGGGLLRIGRAVGARPVAGLGRVAGPGGRAAHGARGACRVLTGGAGAVARVGRGGVGVV